MNIFKTMMKDIAQNQLSTCDRLEAECLVQFLNNRVINMMLIGNKSLSALQDLLQFRNTLDLDHLILWPAQSFTQEVKDILYQKDGNNQPLIDIILMNSGEPIPNDISNFEHRAVRISNSDDQLQILHDIVGKTSLKKRLLYIDNFHDTPLTNKKEKGSLEQGICNLFEEALPICACHFTRTKEKIRHLFA